MKYISKKTLFILFLIVNVVLVCLYAPTLLTLSTAISRRTVHALKSKLSLYVEESLSFTNGTSNAGTQTGKPFNRSWVPFLDALHLTERTVVEIDDWEVVETMPIFVSAISSNHFSELNRNLLQNTNFIITPKRPLILFNLGLTEEQLTTLTNNPNVALRNFMFDEYPSYVRNLAEYRWKPLVIAQSLTEHPSAWYIDASIYFLENTEEICKDLIQLVQNSSLPQHFSTLPQEYSIHSTTDPAIYDYLPLMAEQNKFAYMPQAGSQVIFGTKDIRLRTLKWWVLCALEENCMGSSNYTLACNYFKGHNPIKDFLKCHRYDQSAFSIILGVRYGFQANYYMKEASYMKIRGS